MMILVMLSWPFKKIAFRPMCHPQSCPPEVQSAPTSATSYASKSKLKSKVKSSDSILKEHIIESRRLQDKVETLLSEQDTSHDS